MSWRAGRFSRRNRCLETGDDLAEAGLYRCTSRTASDPQAHITAFRDEPVLNPVTGKIEKVNITASLDVQVPGWYSLELKVSDHTENATGDLSAGAWQLTVSVPVDHLLESGSAGPFRIDSARLIRQVADGQVVADDRFYTELPTAVGAGASTETETGASTQAYSLDALGSQLYFTGENSVTVVRGPEPEHDRLQVRIGIYSESTDCRRGGMIEGPVTERASITDPPGKRMLVVDFTGKDIPHRGPFRIEQVSVVCGSMERLSDD